MWKGANGKFEVWFKEEYVGSFSTLSVARCAWNKMALEWNETVAEAREKYALWDVSPEDILSFERRDPRWKNPTGVWERAKGKFAVWFKEECVGTFSTLSSARCAWNEKAREWNETVAEAREKYALWDVP